MERHAVARLVGAPPGYVGYEEGGQLTEAVRRKPYSVILLDEIEKAHPEAFNMLLQIMEDGSLADAKGRRVDFRNTIIIMTSNVGSDLIRKESALGFTVAKDEVKTAEQKYSKMKEKVTEDLKRVFRPEFLNRIDGQVVFHTLAKEHIRKIVDLQLRELDKALLLKGISLEMTDAAKDWIGEKGYDSVFGARPLRRVIQNELEDRLSEALLQERFGLGDTVMIDIQGDDVIIDKKAPEPAEPALT